MEFKIATSEEILAKLPDWDRQIKALDQSKLTNEQLDQVLDAERMIMEIANQPCEKLRICNRGGDKLTTSLTP